MSRKLIRGIPFNTVTEKDLQRDFFEDSDNPLEKAIEQVYVGKTSYATSDYVRIKATGTDDGVIKFCNSQREVAFEMQHETKRNVPATSTQLLSILTQHLHYYWQSCIKPINPPKYNRKGFISDSSMFFSVIYLDTLDELVKELIPLFNSIKCCASSAWKQPEIKKVMKDFYKQDKIRFQVWNYNSSELFHLDKTYKEIYKHCL